MEVGIFTVSVGVIFVVLFGEAAVNDVNAGWFSEVGLGFCSHFNCREEV